MFPYQNPNLSIKIRVNDLLKRMDVQEKVGQVNQHLYGWQAYKWNKDTKEITFNKVFTDHVAWGQGIGAIYGLFRADPWSKVDYDNGVSASDSWIVANAIQKYVISHSRWGIPALIVEECPHGHQGLDGVSYPTNIGKGNSFDPALVKKSAQLMAKELSYKGVNLALVSTMDLAKDPRWGRTEECYGEDPLLTSRMTQAIIKGFQGSLINEKERFTDKTVSEVNKKNSKIGVVIKHCIAQGEAQGGHNSGTVVIGKSDFQDIYNPIIKASRNAVGVMAAYNDINGIPCHINKKLLDTLLRKKCGFQGLVMADGVALDRLSDAVPNKLEAAGLALDAGVDLSLWDDTYTNIKEGIDTKFINIEELNRAVKHVLEIKFLLGLFDHPYISDPKDKLKEIELQSQIVNKQIAEESITLVKNNGILPLGEKFKHIAVIGPNANNVYNMLGDYTAPQNTTNYSKTIFNELKIEFSEANVKYALGCEIRNKEDQSKNICEALNLARESDLIILALGGSSTRSFKTKFMDNGAASNKMVNMDTGENIDVASLTLGGLQLELLNKLRELKKPIISLLVEGRPYDIQKVIQQSDAVLVCWYPGQMGGTAVSKILRGKVNPSGKLSISYPLNSEQLPVYYYQRDASKQDDYYDESGKPLFKFGYGLSYSKFVYKDLEVLKLKDLIKVKFQILNHGKFDGTETSLVFTRSVGGNVLPRKRVLKSFVRTFLKAGQSKEIELELPLDEFKIINYKGETVLPETITFFVNDLSKRLSLINV